MNSSPSDAPDLVPTAVPVAVPPPIVLPPPDSPSVGELGLQLLGAGIGGWCCSQWGVPVAWLLGPLAVGVLSALVRGRSRPLPPGLVNLGRSLLALVAASRFSVDTIGFAAAYALPLMVCIALASGLSLINGYLLWRWADLDRSTAFLSSIPGASFGMVAMSEEMGADAMAVTVLQYLRVLLVATLVPNLATLLFQTEGAEVARSVLAASPTNPLVLALIPVWMVFGITIGQKLRLPAGSFLGTLLVALGTFWLLPQPVTIPTPLFLLGLLVVGLSIGLRFHRSALQILAKAVIVDIGLILVLILCCLGIAYGFHALTHISTMTAVLGFTPGGLEAMVATVMELGGDTSVVLAMQMTRMFALLLLGPGLVAWLVNRPDRTTLD